MTIVLTRLDETVTVRIVLRLSNCSENILKAQLPLLDIGLNALVFTPSAPGPEESAAAKDMVFAGSVDNKEAPLVVSAFEGNEGSGNHVYVIWKIDAFLRELKLFLH